MPRDRRSNRSSASPRSTARCSTKCSRSSSIEPDYDLNIMTRSQSLTDITTRVLTGMERVLAEAKPDVVLVHGDTTTSSAAALAAFYAKIPVGHVEAGLRTSTVHMPFPEELNRRLTSVISDFHFAPTSALEGEFVCRTRRARVRGRDRQYGHRRFLGNEPAPAPGAARRLPISTRPARSSTSPLTGVKITIAWPIFARALADITRLPEHPSFCGRSIRRRRSRRSCMDCSTACPGIRLVPPLGYSDSVACVAACRFVLTDSGGLQEEAPTLGKPVLVMRNETERPEGLESGDAALDRHGSQRYRRRSSAAAGRSRCLPAHGACQQSVRRRTRRRAHRRLAVVETRATGPTPAESRLDRGVTARQTRQEGGGSAGCRRYVRCETSSRGRKKPDDNRIPSAGPEVHLRAYFARKRIVGVPARRSLIVPVAGLFDALVAAARCRSRCGGTAASPTCC